MLKSNIILLITYGRIIIMGFLIEKYNCWTKNPQNGENLFFAGFINSYAIRKRLAGFTF